MAMYASGKALFTACASRALSSQECAQRRAFALSRPSLKLMAKQRSWLAKQAAATASAIRSTSVRFGAKASMRLNASSLTARGRRRLRAMGANALARTRHSLGPRRDLLGAAPDAATRTARTLDDYFGSGSPRETDRP